jgi:hypothetical protein
MTVVYMGKFTSKSGISEYNAADRPIRIIGICQWNSMQTDLLYKELKSGLCIHLFANIKEKRSLIFYSEMKQEWARE